MEDEREAVVKPAIPRPTFPAAAATAVQKTPVTMATVKTEDDEKEEQKVDGQQQEEAQEETADEDHPSKKEQGDSCKPENSNVKLINDIIDDDKNDESGIISASSKPEDEAVPMETDGYET